ncbi:MAG: helix-turn-helix domain-containing protein [Methylococcales bacterium]|nr:helix-turn-helix domain-containing protein [Methylococcales bacterium]
MLKHIFELRESFPNTGTDSDEDVTVSAIAPELGIVKRTVIKWLGRWKGSPGLSVAERLKDLPRTGCPDKFTAEQICKIIATCCENPSEYGRPITHWSHRELDDELIKQQVVESIPVSEAGRILRENELQPRLSKYSKFKCILISRLMDSSRLNNRLEPKTCSFLKAG